MKGLAKRQPLAEQWAERISTHHQRSVESVIETGRLLMKAKSELQHGEWGRLFDERMLPFDQGTAGRLIAIASHPLLSNSAHAPNLPVSWATLYELTKVPEPTLKGALKDGIITPDMPRKAVKALEPPKPRRVESKPVVTIDIEPAITSWSDDEEADAVREALISVRDLIDRWPDGRSLRLLHHELTQVLKYVERVDKANAQVPA